MSESSVFLAALGERASGLRPEVRLLAAGPGGGAALVGEGVFVEAGSRFWRLHWLARPLVGPGVLLGRPERDVPFTVRFSEAEGADGVAELRTEREVRFPGRTERFVDALRVGPVPGTLRNLLGDRRRVEIELRCSVTGDGGLQLLSERVWVRLWRARIRLPRLLAVRVRSEDGFDERSDRHTIEAGARSPLLGTVLTYRGAFRLRRG